MTNPWAATLILWAVLAVAFVIVWMVRRRRGPIDTGPATTRALGFVNQGGTLDVPGLLFANGFEAGG